MKKILFYLFALALTIMSCNKVLDVKPTDSVAAEDAIKKQGDAAEESKDEKKEGEAEAPAEEVKQNAILAIIKNTVI